MTTIWKSKIYRTRYSRRVEGYLHVEGETRQQALDLLAELASAPGAAGWHAQQIIDGRKRHALTRERGKTPYAAADGTWRGWGEEAWKTSPPAAYSRWRG